MKYVFGETKTDKHEHSFDSIKVKNVTADNPDYNMDKFGVWALIVRYCRCGEELAEDFLQRDKAQEKIDLIMERG